MGLAIGIGFLEGAFFCLIMMMFAFKVLTKADRWIEKNAKYYELYIEFAGNQSVSQFINELHNQKIKISNFELGKSKIKGEGPNALVSIEVKDKKRRATIMDELRQMDCVKYVEEL